MRSQGRKTFDWLYLFKAEDSTPLTEYGVTEACKLCKVALWVGISFLMAAGISQLH